MSPTRAMTSRPKSERARPIKLFADTRALLSLTGLIPLTLIKSARQFSILSVVRVRKLYQVHLRAPHPASNPAFLLWRVGGAVNVRRGCYRILNTLQSALRLESGFLEASQIIFRPSGDSQCGRKSDDAKTR
jgi:hypothetical protein